MIQLAAATLAAASRGAPPTVNGKVAVFALPAEDAPASIARQNIAAPGTPLPEALTQIAPPAEPSPVDPVRFATLAGPKPPASDTLLPPDPVQPHMEENAAALPSYIATGGQLDLHAQPVPVEASPLPTSVPRSASTPRSVAPQSPAAIGDTSHARASFSVPGLSVPGQEPADIDDDYADDRTPVDSDPVVLAEPQPLQPLPADGTVVLMLVEAARPAPDHGEPFAINPVPVSFQPTGPAVSTVGHGQPSENTAAIVQPRSQLTPPADLPAPATSSEPPLRPADANGFERREPSFAQAGSQLPSAAPAAAASPTVAIPSFPLGLHPQPTPASATRGLFSLPPEMPSVADILSHDPAAPAGPRLAASLPFTLVAPAAGIAASATAPAHQIFGPAIAAARQRERLAAGSPVLSDLLGSAGGLDLTAPASATPPTISTPVPPTAAPVDLTDAQWPHMMMARIEALRDAADVVDTRIRVIPDALGTIDIDLRRDGDTVHVRFIAEQPQTRAILQDAQPRLAEAADARGLRLGQTSVDGGAFGAGASGSNGSAANTSHGGQHRQPAPDPRRPASAFANTPRDRTADADDDARIA